MRVSGSKNFVDEVWGVSLPMEMRTPRDRGNSPGRTAAAQSPLRRASASRDGRSRIHTSTNPTGLLRPIMQPLPLRPKPGVADAVAVPAGVGELVGDDVFVRGGVLVGDGVGVPPALPVSEKCRLVCPLCVLISMKPS